MEYLSHSPEETEHIGEELGRTLHAGSVVAYRGGLGMGKTAFTRGLARGLGCRGRVTSPTFTIVNEYSGDIPLFHFDMYRLGGEDELFDIGWEDFLRREGREPTIGELAELLSCDPAEAAEIVGVMQPTVSINSAGEDGDATLDIPVDDSEQLFDRLTVLQAMDGLEKSEQMLVELRYYKGLTQCKTAEILGLSQVQVSRKEKAVLQKMRRVMDG